MANEKLNPLWPSWATWALVAIIATSLLTVAATINDIW
jgi:hypothetical protein